MVQKNFKVDSLPNTELRIGKVPIVELLALGMTQMDLSVFKNSVEVFTYALEHTEVKVGDKWDTVKYPGKEIYLPFGIEENFAALNEIVTYFIVEVINKTF